MASYFKRVISGIGGRIKRCRLALGMSKARLASKAGLSRPTITYYENHQTTPTLQSLRKLANALGVTVDYLVGIEKDPKDSGDLKIRLLFKNIGELNEQEILLMEEMYDRIRKRNGKRTTKKLR